ncbi:MAG: hypothetical protein AAGP08_19205 [Pseudomonadota bacterium]
MVSLAPLRKGYGWRFPKQQTTTIGVGGRHVDNPDLKEAMQAYLDRSGVAVPTQAIKGQFLPWGDYRKTPGARDVLLAGDAAGLVDPITGEGIALAMKSGQLAAEAAHVALGAGAPEQALAGYCAALRPIHRSLRIANRMRILFFHTACAGYFERALTASTTLKRDYLDLLAGDKEYPEILTGLLRRALRIAFGLVRHRFQRKTPRHPLRNPGRFG